jgi:hypothetical protein
MKNRVLFVARLLAATSLLCVASLASAQTVPVSVNVNGQVATVRIGPATAPIADLTLTFDDASNLTPASLGIAAQLVNPADPTLLSRLSNPQLLQPDAAFPLLVTVEPPVAGNLRFLRTVRVEVHTHALTYSVGSSYRLFKAPTGGQFRDITDEIAPGSVRARGTTSGFSQFLVLTDLRQSDAVVADKFAALRSTLAGVAAAERGDLMELLDQAEAAVASGNFSAAGNSVDDFRARVAQRAGKTIAQEWRAGGALGNPAGALLAGAATLKFSIAYLRDFGL